MAYDYTVNDITIYKAALEDDWDSVSQLFEQEPDLMTKTISCWLETPLMIAVGTGSSHNFVKKLVERIVAVGAKDKMFLPSSSGSNSLNYAAKVGNTSAAKILVDLDPSMTLYLNEYSLTPVLLAAMYGNKETLQYLLAVTPDSGPGEEGTSPYSGVAGGNLITFTIMAGFYDVALQIIDRHPNIVFESNRNDQTALQALALKPEIFPSGSRLGFWGRLIYPLIPLKKCQDATQAGKFLGIFNEFTAGFWSALGYVAPIIKRIHDTKVNNGLSNQLVKRICKTVIEKGDHDIAWKILGSAIATAVKYGTLELIEECIVTYPTVIWYDINGNYLLLAAIRERQERVYNLVYQMSRHQVMLGVEHCNGWNGLHFAAALAPYHRLNVVTGAALQMQRELQWFQELENYVLPSYKEEVDGRGRTPRMVFTESHAQLLEKGQQWMKDTASSCTVVAALVVTMAFAAAFTVPGGNQDDGKPLFQDNGSFMLFIVADAIALFSSSTSALMFLGILTSRYAEGDFLYALPKRLTIGLLSLFLSLAATLIAFSATLALVLQDKVTWIAAPLIVATSVPVCLFALLQFPLLVELVYSTYGPSIFHKQGERMIH